MGYFMTSVQLPTGASLERTDRIVRQVSDSISSLPQVKGVISISGMSFLAGGAGSNLGSMFVVLKPWKERKGKENGINAVIAKVNEMTAPIQEAITFSINPPAIPGLGMTSGLQMQLLDINNLGAKEMEQAIDEIRNRAASDPRIRQITSLYQGSVPQYQLVIDRDRVKMQHLTLEDVYATLGDFMGSSYVNDFVKFDRVYQVTIGADAASRAHISDVPKLSVRNSLGEMVPFSTFTKIVPSVGQSTVSRYNMYNTASVTATPAKGTSSSEGIKAMEEIVDEALGSNYSYAWTGEAYQETQSGTTVTMVMIFAVILTILVIAAQYESWTDPIAVVISMPTAILGTVLGCVFMQQSISIYTQIGIILLLGLSAKNAILIVGYARDYRAAGQPIRQAAEDAGRVRFRPIMMTALAFVLGVMPMLFATGAGAQSRISLGTAVVFGMAVNAVIGTLFVPNFWELLQTFREKYLSKIFASSDTPVSQSATPPPDKSSEKE